MSGKERTEMSIKEEHNSNYLSKRIILMAECIILISSALFCGVSIYRARTSIRKNIQQRMLDIANCAAGSIDGNILGSLEKEDVGSDVYNDLYRKLAVFRDNVELEYIYSFRETKKGHFEFTMDLDQVRPAEFGESVEYTDAMGSAAKGIPAVDNISYKDKWGEFYSAYSPVFDSNGRIAGIIGVDFSASWFDDQLSSQTHTMVVSYLIILLISLLVAAVLLVTTVRPFVKMHGQLLEEKVRAESANLAKSDFLANMSHEIRTPINAMLGMNEMILRESREMQRLDGTNPFATKESVNNIMGYAGDVESAGQNLLAIINDILDFSKIDSGNLDLVAKPYKVRSLINDVKGLIFMKARDKGLDLIIDEDPLLPEKLRGDELRVRQILTNLMNNAVKYTDHGSITLMMRGSKQDDGTYMLEAAVKDTGIGIKQEDLDKLFSRFQRLEMERNSTVEGTGLGLAITQRLLALMDGSITVESEYGKGSVFTVRLPQKTVETDEEVVTEPAEPVSKVTEREPFEAPNARVLAVDDTAVNLAVVTQFLRNSKMVVDTVTSGVDAVRLAKDNHYDVILMDQRMPGMDGTEALAQIRATQGGASCDTPVICFTADAVVGAKERYMSEGFSDYLTKPVTGYALEKILLKHLPADKVSRISQ